MAVLGKIRSKGALLVGIIGLGLFAFIAEEAFRSCESTRNESRQQVGEILGKKVNVQEFQALIDEYSEVIKVTQGRENLSEEELNHVKDQIWNNLVQNGLIEAECEKIGLTVTDQEMANVLAAGTHPALRQTPFVNQQTGLFDVNQLKKFIEEYKKSGSMSASNPQVYEQMKAIYNYWTYTEKALRQQLLADKYQSLLASAFISNPISAKSSYDASVKEKNIQLASLAYSSINDKDVKISDSDIKAKYDEMKEMFLQPMETRDIKYVSVKVEASPEDRAALNKEITAATDSLRNSSNVGEVIRKSNSLMAYVGLPVSEKALPRDIKSMIDSMAVGQTVGPKENKMDNTINVVRLLSKVQAPDSIEFRQIQVGGESIDQAREKADSIYKALQGGADFEVIAKKYGQEGKKTWLTSAMYEGGQAIEGDNLKYLKTLTTSGVNELKNVELATGNIIVQVTDRRNNIAKYDVAVIKRTIDFSKDTYSAAYNKFSQFVSEVGSDFNALADKAKKHGYTVEERKNISSADHNIIGLRATRDAMKWLFDAKQGDVSPLYECGNNDNLLVIALNGIHKEGYRSEKDTEVEALVKAEVLKDKKFEMLAKKLDGVKSIDQAKAKGAQVTDVNQITFNSPVFVAATGTAESALSGAVAATKNGQFSAKPVKGNAGAYVFKVVGENTNNSQKFDEKTEEQKLARQAMQGASRFMSELYQKAKIVDKRYLFF